MIKPEQKSNTICFSRRATDIYIYVMLAVFPLFTGFEGYSNLTLSKYIFFVSVSALWLISLVIFAVIEGANPFLKGLSIAGLLLLLYLDFCFVSAVFSPYKYSVLLGEGRFDGLITTFLCVGTLIGVSLYARPKRSYIYVACFAASVNCVIAVLQLLGYNPFFLFPGDFDFYDAGKKFSSTFLGTIGNADLFSAYLCLIFPLTAIYYICSEKRLFSLLPVVLLTSFCLFVCGVSAGILAVGLTVLIATPFVITSGERLRKALEIALVALAAATIVFIVNITEVTDGVTVDFHLTKIASALLALAAIAALARLLLRKSNFTRKTLCLFFSTLCGLVFVSSLLIAYFWKGTYGTVYELSQLMHGNIQDSFGSSRILIWRKTLELVPERLVLGGGPGTLALMLDVNFSRYVEETGKTLSTAVDNAHNEYLGILINTGLLSLIAYIAAQFVSLFMAAKSAKLCNFSSALACCLLCYWVQSFFGLGLFIVSPVMWLIWGLLISELRYVKN